MQDHEELIFKDIDLNGKPLRDCELVYEDKDGNVRLYVDKEPENRSFYAHAVEFNSCDYEPDTVICWDSDGLTVTSIFEVKAYGSGVRHMYWGYSSGMEMVSSGYIYSPDIKIIIELLQKIRELEIHVCKIKDN